MIPSLMQPSLAFISLPGGIEWVVILIIGLLLFGRRLPEIGRSFGKTITEFKKGMQSIDEEPAGVTRQPAASASAGTLPAGQAATAPAADRRVSTHDSVET